LDPPTLPFGPYNNLPPQNPFVKIRLWFQLYDNERDIPINRRILECGPMPNVMVALSNIVNVVC